MSRIASSSSASGVRIAAQPLSNVYTVLLMVAALALVVALVFVCLPPRGRQGSILPVGAAGEQTRRDIEDAQSRQKAADAELNQMQQNLGQWPQGGGGAPAPAAAPEVSTD
ncbi:MAG: hypothetical protein WBD63_02185 [Phycisphaerae bacterium]|nr:hypothetical protein [Phycisphaerae bacterium]